MLNAPRWGCTAVASSEAKPERACVPAERYVPTSVRQSTPLSLVCRAGRRRELDQGLGNGRSGDNHGGSGAERRRAKRGGAERRILHGRAAIVRVWGEGPRS